MTAASLPEPPAYVRDRMQRSREERAAGRYFATLARAERRSDDITAEAQGFFNALVFGEPVDPEAALSIGGHVIQQPRSWVGRVLGRLDALEGRP